MSDAQLILESSPGPQARMSYPIGGNSVVVGRGDDADWQLDDPDMYLSRKHCVIAVMDGRLTATDTSRGGTFVDGAEQPVGTGNAIALTDGMRLRMGDFVFRVDMASATPTPEPRQKFSSSFTFAPAPAETAEAAPRPDTLPPPFDPFAESTASQTAAKQDTTPPKPLDMDDPFGLDLPTRETEAPAPTGNRFFDTPLSAPLKPEAPPPEPTPPPIATEPEPTPPPAPQPVATDDALRAALLRGMGVDPDRMQTADPVAQMEAIGTQYRYLIEGVMHLLRARASEKQQVRVAQTLISSADVNPLKFLATVDDAITTMLDNNRPGYLDGPAAINGAYRDLADHQVRTWKALQSALRRMIDQFDPTEIEKTLDDSGMLESLLAGGRNAQLWRAYEERYQEIARAAEERFLGEVGENFRDAYEGKEETGR
ncbi:type VI secretion system-associated FHA domain protein TagH [Cognatiyoonia sp. IB215182]|uniref:type VI secretion system-associated FHA domain protein TagH n=1 Tax=Cognatiyoonia sp. IB215182 TaxID=3097353 RepID=UPI002A13F814|nr:type VI secretion system-associated FHA domain protein TagH [Cognatiyoonia sp. IB215182]MDX8352701.1 type VI secretion system-associated FHA domain protein TagH [Cognatiyoonia sp. IB215182]